MVSRPEDIKITPSTNLSRRPITPGGFLSFSTDGNKYRVCLYRFY
jgi:hypothetical protein